LEDGEYHRNTKTQKSYSASEDTV